MSKNNILNKTMDFRDLLVPEANVIIEELNDLIILFRNKNLKISSWYGCFDLSGANDSFEFINRGYDYQALANIPDDKNFPWFLYWEIVWVILNNDFKQGQSLIDLGGSSSLFSYYLASKGLKVITVDLNKDLVENANFVAQEMNWNLINHVMNIKDINLKSQFDHITSICVFEHIPMFERVVINKKIHQLLKPNGTFSITFDYKNPSLKAQISTPEDVYQQFIKPSNLMIRGNKSFYDNNKNYLLHPFFYRPLNYKFKQVSIDSGCFKQEDFHKLKDKNDYTFGALFLIKQ